MRYLLSCFCFVAVVFLLIVSYRLDEANLEIERLVNEKTSIVEVKPRSDVIASCRTLQEDLEAKTMRFVCSISPKEQE